MPSSIYIYIPHSKSHTSAGLEYLDNNNKWRLGTQTSNLPWHTAGDPKLGWWAATTLIQSYQPWRWMMNWTLFVISSWWRMLASCSAIDCVVSSQSSRVQGMSMSGSWSLLKGCWSVRRVLCWARLKTSSSCYSAQAVLWGISCRACRRNRIIEPYSCSRRIKLKLPSTFIPVHTPIPNK